MVAASSLAVPTSDVTVRHIGVADLHWSLRQGLNDFLALRGDILFAGVIYPVLALLAAAFALNADMIPLIFPMAAAFSLLGPMIAIGFYELAKRREEGLDIGWSHFLDPLRGPARWQILALAAMLTLIAIAWMFVARAIYDATLGTLAPAGPVAFVSDLFGTDEGWRLIVFGNLAGLCFAIVTLAISLVSFPMLVDRRNHASDAVETSLRATLRNPLMVARWGLYVAVILAIACVPLFLGLAVALPVLGYASWHLYSRIVER
ncbi:DUF2189 domain-containing protein [Sphingomonas colocasiae]|uniref:DUF2189 domain-containing protein n=1 Tax=Sphingomonas colocasiae TaxID=1848973 RepID=A0ABS7PIR9_9SPHN|nr:DUF2189 domain-containing protein [Sphingomonas colocasiae]MBY8821199.1 DUF2189 domain-containing protein [Sphingomonas colocasiae]